MLKILIIVSVLIWFLILLFLISQRGFVLLLIWLLIAPVVSNLVNRPGSNPFFKTTPVTQSKPRGHAYITYETTIRPRDLLEPTRLIFIVFLVLFLAGYVADRKRLGALDTTEILMCAFSFILIASVLFQSRRLAFGLHVVADAFVVPFLGYFIARKLVTSEDRLRKLMKVMGYLGLYLIVISLIERLTHQEVLYRLTGPFESIHMFYVVMTVVFFVMFLDSMSSQGFAGEQAVPRSIRRFVLYMSPVIIFLNWTRGGWAGFLLGLWVFLFLGRRQVNFLQKLGAVGSVLILLPVTAAGVYALQPQEIIEERIANVSNVYARLGAWRIIIQEAIKRPILGIGLNNLRDELYESRVRYAGVRSETTSHNSFLSLFTELGAVGLFAYLAICASIIQRGLSLNRTGEESSDRWRGIAVVAIMLAYLGSALFSNTLYLTRLGHIYVYVFVGAIAGLYGHRQSTSDLDGSPENPRLQNNTTVPLSL